jgi:putative transposase
VSYTNLNYHSVFSTKNHTPFLNEAEMNQLFEYIGGIINNMKATLLWVGGTEDHVHIAVRLHPELSIVEFIRTVKTNASKWVHDTLSENFSWQEGYSAVSQSIVGKVIEYIRGQKEHHRKLLFKEELESFLKKT